MNIFGLIRTNRKSFLSRINSLDKLCRPNTPLAREWLVFNIEGTKVIFIYMSKSIFKGFTDPPKIHNTAKYRFMKYFLLFMAFSHESICTGTCLEDEPRGE